MSHKKGKNWTSVQKHLTTVANSIKLTGLRKMCEKSRALYLIVLLTNSEKKCTQNPIIVLVGFIYSISWLLNREIGYLTDSKKVTITTITRPMK